MPQTYNDAFAWVKKGDGESDRLNKKKRQFRAAAYFGLGTPKPSASTIKKHPTSMIIAGI
jgi:hypothetical protein